MHGAGNDFVIINNIIEKLPEAALPTLARKLCAVHSSLGADGMMVVVPPKNGGDYGMLFYNSDGSLGEMCGNGARCIARYGYENALAGETQRIETTAGLVIGQRISKRRYKVRLNDPAVIDLHRRLRVLGTDCDCAYIELGEPGIPHAVLIVPELEELGRQGLRELGAALRFAPEFPKGANINFVKQLGEDSLRVLTFERGVDDFTLACGTGCGSAVIALSMLGLVSGKDVQLINDGGELRVSISLEHGTAHDIYLSGPTNIVAIGEILDEDLIF